MTFLDGLWFCEAHIIILKPYTMNQHYESTPGQQMYMIQRLYFPVVVADGLGRGRPAVTTHDDVLLNHKLLRWPKFRALG